MPRVDTLDRLLAACGLRLGVSVDPSTIDAMLRLSPAQRLRRLALEGRELERMLEEDRTDEGDEAGEGG